MKRLLPIALVLTACIAGCRGGEVLIEQNGQVKSYDSIPTVFYDTPDSTKLKIHTTEDWSIEIAKGGEWCYVSNNKGSGDSEVIIYVKENPTPDYRSTSLILSTQTNCIIYKVKQKGGQAWFLTNYWKRSDAQRFGLRGDIKYLKDVDASGSFFEIEFNKQGNVTICEFVKKVPGGYEPQYKMIHRYDSADYRTSSMLIQKKDTTFYKYEYANTGMFIASGNTFTLEPKLNEAAPIIPDLSAIHAVNGNSGYDVDFFFVGEKLYQVCTYNDDGQISADTVTWEYRNGMPYNNGKVSNTLYYSNGMFKLVEMEGYRYRFVDNHHVPAIESKEYFLNDAKKGQVIKVVNTLNENRDVVERQTTFMGDDELFVEWYDNYTYDHHHNWTLCDYQFLDEGEMCQKGLIHEIRYW